MRFAEDIVALEPLLEIVSQAGELLKKYYGGRLDKQYKQDGSFATEADKASEAFLIAKLQALLPEAGIWAEESGNLMDGGESDLYWVIDPLDGTNNFSQGIPFSCISVALVKEKRPVVGIIYDFHRKEMFVASEGHGAYLNGVPIQVSQKRDLEKAMIGAPMAYKGDASAEVRHLFWDCMQRVDRRCMSIRVLGAAALDLAYAASGRFDAVFFDSLSWWDVAAGVVLIQEAGGIVTTYDGQPVDHTFKSLVGGASALHHQLKTVLNQ